MRPSQRSSGSTARTSRATTLRCPLLSGRTVAPWTEAVVAGDEEVASVEIAVVSVVAVEEVAAAVVLIVVTCRKGRAIGSVARAATRTLLGVMSATGARRVSQEAVEEEAAAEEEVEAVVDMEVVVEEAAVAMEEIVEDMERGIQDQCAEGE